MKNSILTTLVCLGLAQASFSQATYPNDTAPKTTETSTTPTPSTAQENYNNSDAIDARPLSKGGFLIEPMILGSQEDATIKTSQLPIITDDTSGTSNGFGVGMRMGGHINEMFLLGLDARYSKMKMDDSFYRQADSNVYNLAPVIGVQTPYYGIRLLAGYVVAGESDPNAGYRGLDLKFKEANGWRVGAGLFIAAVSVNVEYQDLTYNSTEIQSFGDAAVNNSTSVDANSRGYSLSLSFPVEM